MAAMTLVIEIAGGIILAVLFFLFLPYIIVAASGAFVAAVAAAVIAVLAVLGLELALAADAVTPSEWAKFAIAAGIIAAIGGLLGRLERRRNAPRKPETLE
jgi:hypothetical protein